jgi:hypothetical protein
MSRAVRPVSSAPVELGEALRPRYVDAPARAGLYESLFLTAHHPTEPWALWVRHTVLKPKGAAARASLWCTWFAGGRVRAGKVSTSRVSSTADHPLEVGDHGRIGADGAAGAVELDTLRASWDLEFADPEPAMFHLPRPWMYTAPVPRTKSMSAAPMVTVTGSLMVDGQAVDVDGWPCSIGHNWGAEHAERWIWLHVDARAGEGPVWLDVIVGRIRLGPLTTPWIANGVVSIAGGRYRLGGLRLGLATPVTEQARGAAVELRGTGIAVDVAAEIDLGSCVAWTYADPAGHTREVVNSSVARIGLTIRREGRPPLEVTSPVSAFELGADRRVFDVPLQPFPD